MSKFTWKKARVILLVLAVLMLLGDGTYWLFNGKALQGDFYAKLWCVCYGFTWVMEYVDALAADSQAICKRLDDLTERLELIEERLDSDAL